MKNEINDVFTPFVYALFGKEGNPRVLREVGFVKSLKIILPNRRMMIYLAPSSH